MTDGTRVHERTTIPNRERGVDSTLSRSLRVSAAAWESAQAKAAEDGVVINKAITELLEGYFHGVYEASSTTTRRTTVGPTIVRSLRVPTALWEDAHARAERDAVPLNRVIAALVEGYSRGAYALPTTTSVTVRKTYPLQPAI